MTTDRQENRDYDERREKSKMVQRSISIEPNFWERCKEKAGLTPISAIVRRLLELWLEGKIKID
ncbi:MAG: hypothetical protein BroJett011_77120 [Chloroflexota bacterium]|nr:MAG: hypothetical protein BroJett011_77120 [Chloroflexota bacterium]